MTLLVRRRRARSSAAVFAGLAARPLDRAARRSVCAAASPELAAGDLGARRRRERAAGDRRARAARSTRWRRISRSSSTSAASSSPGRATTCARRSPRCRRCSRRSRTASPSPRSTCRRCASRCASCSTIVDDLFELARIDAGVADARARRGAARPAGRGLPARARAGGAGAADHPRRATWTARRPCCARRRRSSACSTTCSRTRSGTRRPTASRSPCRRRVRLASRTRRGLRHASRTLERFWRADRPRTVRGSGLGLAIARGFVEAQGGRIWAREPRPAAARASRSRFPPRPDIVTLRA